MLLREGYVRATTNRIAEEAGVSVGTLYQYFANKDDFFDALIRREVGAIVEQAAPALARPAGSPAEVLRRALVAVIGVQPHGPALYRALEQVPDSLFRRRVAEAKQQLEAGVRQLLERYRDQIALEDLDMAAFVIVSAAEGVGYNTAPDRFDERLASELATLFDRYLTGGS